MRLIDTHIHLYAEEFESDREELIRTALKSGVSNFILPNIDMNSLSGMMELCDQYPDHCFPMIGLHPCYVNADYVAQLKSIRNALDENLKQVVAVGEIGLDFHWDLTFKNEQEAAFRKQVEWAAEFNLPISIHSRNSTGEIIAILRDMNISGLTGVFHCFSGDINQADEIVNLGFLFGIGGVVTFKNSGLAVIVKELPLDSLILETDGPYLAPTPYRGKRNEPAYLKLIAEEVARIKETEFNIIAEATTRNAKRLFQLTIDR